MLLAEPQHLLSAVRSGSMVAVGFCTVGIV
jgi:hypothetical protein